MDNAVRSQLVGDRASHRRWDRETKTNIATRWRQDLAVDPHQLTLQVDERATRVALVDRRVRLQEVFVAPVADTGRPSLPAHDPHRDRLTDAQRIAEREHDVAHFHAIGVTEAQRGKIAARRS